jgi:hypothetical protein
LVSRKRHRQFEIIDCVPVPPILTKRAIIWTAAGCSLALALYLSGLTVWSVWTAKSEVPWRDQWTFLDDARAILAHEWSRLWYTYWGHRPVIARLVTLLDVRWFSGLNTPILILMLAMQAAHAALLICVAWVIFGRMSLSVFVAASALFIQLSFSSLQMENFIWGAQIGYILVWTGATAAFFLLARGSWVALGGCLLAAVVSTLSSPAGLFVWPVLLLQAWVLRVSMRVRALLLLTAVVVIGAYLWEYEAGPPLGMGPLRALLHPEQSIPVLGMLIAAPLSVVSIRGAMAAGCVSLVIAVYVLIKVQRYRPPAFLTVYSALAVFALLTFASLVSSRISPEFIAERVGAHFLVIPSRYYTMVAFFWAGVAGVSIWMVMKNKREWVPVAALGSMVAIVTLGTVWWQVGEAANWRGFYRELDVAGSALIMHVDDPANPALAQIYPASPLRSEVSAWLEKERLALFSERRARLPGTRVQAPDATCRGAEQNLAAVRDGVFRITGWALDARTGRPPLDLVVVDDATHTIIGVARSGLRRPDLGLADTVGWQGYVKGVPATQVSVYGAVDGTGRYCLVAGSLQLKVAGSPAR